MRKEIEIHRNIVTQKIARKSVITVITTIIGRVNTPKVAIQVVKSKTVIHRKIPIQEKAITTQARVSLMLLKHLA